MQDDWRIANQMSYLYRAKLKRAKFEATPANDHEHCEFCFDKFGENENLLKSGYCTLNEYYWICDGCFRDFQKQFEWKVVP